VTFGASFNASAVARLARAGRTKGASAAGTAAALATNPRSLLATVLGAGSALASLQRPPPPPPPPKGIDKSRAIKPFFDNVESALRRRRLAEATVLQLEVKQGAVHSVDWRGAVRELHRVAGVLKRRDTHTVSHARRLDRLPSGGFADEHSTGLPFLDVRVPRSPLGDGIRRLEAFLKDEPYDHAEAALLRSLPRGSSGGDGFWHRIQSESAHTAPGRRLATSLFGAATAVPLAAADVSSRYGLIPKRGKDFFTELARFVVYDVLLCYLYKPEGGDAGELGDGTGLEVHHTNRMCFPAIPFSLNRLGTFRSAIGLSDSFDFASLEYEEGCNSETVRSVIDSIGEPDQWNAGPFSAVLRGAEAVDSIRNLAASGNASLSETERGALIVCGIAQLGGVLFSALVAAGVLLCCGCAPLGGAACIVCLRLFRRRRAIKANRETEVDRLVTMAKERGWLEKAAA
jgi:hypothetical protein